MGYGYTQRGTLGPRDVSCQIFVGEVSGNVHWVGFQIVLRWGSNMSWSGFPPSGGLHLDL